MNSLESDLCVETFDLVVELVQGFFVVEDQLCYVAGSADFFTVEDNVGVVIERADIDIDELF